MKNIFIIVALFLLVSVSQAQEIATRVISLRGLTSGTLFSVKAYTDNLSDTSQSISLLNYRDAYLRFNTLDSVGAAVIWYQPVITGSTYHPKVTIATLTAGTNNGGYAQHTALPATVLAASRVRLGITFAGSANGVSTATYTLDVVVK
jgi:hypothetical protein